MIRVAITLIFLLSAITSVAQANESDTIIYFPIHIIITHQKSKKHFTRDTIDFKGEIYFVHNRDTLVTDYGYKKLKLDKKAWEKLYLSNYLSKNDTISIFLVHAIESNSVIKIPFSGFREENLLDIEQIFKTPETFTCFFWSGWRDWNMGCLTVQTGTTLKKEE